MLESTAASSWTTWYLSCLPRSHIPPPSRLTGRAPCSPHYYTITPTPSGSPWAIVKMQKKIRKQFMLLKRWQLGITTQSKPLTSLEFLLCSPDLLAMADLFLFLLQGLVSPPTWGNLLCPASEPYQNEVGADLSEELPCSIALHTFGMLKTGQYNLWTGLRQSRVPKNCL